MSSLVRLDPIPDGSLGFRAYSSPVDPGAPLAEMRMDYDITGVVTIRGEEAEVTMTRGDLSRRALRDFELLLWTRGVRVMVWDRHLPDGTVRRVRKVVHLPAQAVPGPTDRGPGTAVESRT